MNTNNRVGLLAFAAWFGLMPVPCRAQLPPSATVQIGNFYYQAPNGIAFIKDNAAAFVINPGGSFNAGTVAPDDSFHRTMFTPSKATPGQRVEFQWSRQGDIVVGRLVSEKPGEMTFKLGENWPGFSSQFSASGNGVKGEAVLPVGKSIFWALQTSPAPTSADGTQITVPLSGPARPTYLAAGFGELPSLEGIDARLASAAAAYENHRPKASCPTGDILGAISDNLNNTRLYSSDNHLVAINVSRTFGGAFGPDCVPYFGWDSFFNGMLASIADPVAGRQTVRAILSGQNAEGLVPNYCHWNPARGGISHDRSEPPVGALCVWRMQQYWPDMDFLREVYPQLARWHAWWMTARNARQDGLLEWGSGDHDLQGAKYETGWDDTPHFEGARMVGNTMNVYAVDLCALWAADAYYLALIADAIDQPDDARAYLQEEVDMNARINAKLWNEKLGIYCSRFWDHDDGTPGEFLTRLTPANFYPLISGAPNEAQARRVLAVMTDPDQFWGEWILPTVSRQDPLFFQQRYWHGTVWGPVNYLVFQGVKRYASPEIQASFAQKSVRLFMNNWLATGQCGENFLSLDGKVGGNQNYTWGALLCLTGLESVVEIDDHGIPKAGPTYGEPVELTNLPIGGKPFHVSVYFGKPEVTITHQTTVQP